VDHRQHAREFLVSRRAKLTPAQANLPAGTNRRVPGLRRSEVAALRTEAGRDPHDKDLQKLVGELSTRSEEFRKRWGAHNLRHHGTGAKTYHHPIVGDLTLAYEGLELAAEPGLTSPSTPPSPARHPRRRCACSPAGPRPRTKRLPSHLTPTPERATAAFPER
jgi:hypothetical protein